jgi:hypothetical protein
VSFNPTRTHDPKNGPKTPYRGKIGWETKSQPAIKGRQMSFNNLIYNNNMNAKAMPDIRL